MTVFTDCGAKQMWYFTWVLGLAFACAFGVLNAMWLEVHENDAPDVRDEWMS